MAMNFYETSIKKLNIKSYLFLSPSPTAYQMLKANGVSCFKYSSDAASENRSEFNTRDFVRKMNIRTYVILEALKLGYHVLHSDVDMIFYRDPFDDLPCQNDSCDAAILWDYLLYNAGFVYARSSAGSLALYTDMEKTANTTNTDDQSALNQAVARLGKKIRTVTLNTTKYACGKSFYESRKHAGDGLPPNYTRDVIVSHNNWIVGVEAKVYRFKEMQQWYYDEDGYYSNPSTKYLRYQNTEPLVRMLEWNKEENALQNAFMIGSILNRSVILPKFHCSMGLCSLLCWIRLKNFHNVFGNYYREHLFLRHPKVPLSTTTSVSPQYAIFHQHVNGSSQYSNALHYRPNDTQKGPTAKEILQWFGDESHKILEISVLDGNFDHLRKLPFGKYSSFKDAFAAGLIRGNYMQILY